MFAPDDLTNDAFLGGKLSVLQPKDGYRAGTDPVLLAAACPARSGQSVLELGCGVGTTLLCLSARVEVKASGLERLPNYANLAVRNFEQNNVSAQIHIGDLETPPSSLRDQTFDHTLINPPFFKDGKRADDMGRASGRQEETPLELWIDHALRRTKPKGYLTLIHLAERLGDIIALLNARTGNIEIKPLAARNERNPKRIIIRARKGAKGPTKLYNPLIMHAGSTHDGDKDSFSTKAKAILKHARSLEF